MRCSPSLLLLTLVACRAVPPASAVDVTVEAPAVAVDAVVADASSAAPEPDAPPAARPPRVVGLIDELAGVVNAALAGRDLPDTRFRLPGHRGEQVVRVQSASWPEGELTVVASLLKIDVTLDGCPPGGGLTIGLVQTESGVHLVGLGDQFRASELPAPRGLAEVATLAEQVLRALAAGGGAGLVLGDDRCERDFGSLERCRRIFREIPGEATLTRYQDMLSACRSQPAISLALVSLWLRDQAGVEYQGLVRLTVTEGRVVVSEPILIASGLE